MKSSLLLSCGLALLLSSSCVRAQDAPRPFLHPLFSDGAVIQRDRKVPAWGFARPGEHISVQLDGRLVGTAATDTTGKWMTQIGPVAAGMGHTLDVSGPTESERAHVKDLAFGDVWLCSGQSNMEMNLTWGVNNAAVERQNANFPGIRFFHVPRVAAVRPRQTLDMKWQAISPTTVDGVSAVAYFFGREIHQKIGVPIGLIDSAWSGTDARVWASGDVLERLPDFKAGVAAVRQTREDVPLAEQLAAWNQKNDPGFRDNWAAPAFDDSRWAKALVPGAFTSDAAGDLTAFDGAVWYRKAVNVPANMAGKEAQLSLGAIDDADTTFWNGVRIGATDGFDKPRRYTIPAEKMRAGHNVLSVRVFDTGGPGGFMGKTGDLKLEGGGQTLPLGGEWRLARGVPLAATARNPPPVDVTAFPSAPGVLYNSMISPLLPYGLKGAIWYQGESNAGNPQQYKTLLPAMIGDWRARFGAGDFPFYLVQLAGYQAPDETPVPNPNSWANIREVQASITRIVPNSAYSVTTDIGDAKDIHPKNKQDVGKRLALLALARDYGQKVESSGPTVRSMSVEVKPLRLGMEHNAVRLRLDHAAGGLTFAGEPNRVFIIAGQDQKWAWATPTIEGNSIVLSSPEVPNPVAVRFAWSNFPRGHVYNGAHLPMAPYRSDSW